MSEGIYHQLDPKEIDRLIEMSDYPDSVIVEMIKDHIVDGTTVLDAGAGPNIGLSQFVETAGGRYFPFDINPSMLVRQRATLSGLPEPPPQRPVLADVRNFPYPDSAFNIVNMRFVLSHLPEKDWPRAIQEAARVAGNFALVSEHDWGTLQSKTHPNFLSQVLSASLEFTSLMGIDPYAGTKLYKMTREALEGSDKTDWSTSESRHPRPEADYSRELISLCSASAAMAGRTGYRSLAKEFTTIVDHLNSHTITFVPPDIVVVKIERPTEAISAGN